MGTLRFVLRNDKTTKDGKAPIGLIYQIAGNRNFHFTGLKIHPDSWDQENQKAKWDEKLRSKKKEEIKELEKLNYDIEGIKRSITDIEKHFELESVKPNAEEVIERLKKKFGEKTSDQPKRLPSKVLFDFIDHYIQDNRLTRVPGSLKVYGTLKNHLKEYNKNATFDKINYDFFKGFESHLIFKKGLCKTTVAKQLSTLKTFLNYARKDKKINIPPIDFKIDRKNERKVIALTQDEFDSLYTLDLSKNKRLEQVRDVFCFACATGLRYSDLKQLRREHIKSDLIEITVIKTSQQLTIPLNTYSSDILQKYSQHSLPLPVISNQRMNEYLKELCKQAEINEPIEIIQYRGSKREATVYPKYELISVHVARKTFCTLSLERGLNAEETMAISGHLDYRSFKCYVDVNKERKKKAMSKAWGAPAPILKAV